jgi:UDP-N-acetylglucosamine 2-epimerase (non-hydrolysing)
VLDGILGALHGLGEAMPIIFPVHPRTRQKLNGSHGQCPGLRLMEPLGYLEFLRLISNARMVLTDSGGVQEETTMLGVRCLTLRTSTERPATIDQGTNTLVGLEPGRIRDVVRSELSRPTTVQRVPKLWDGAAASRIVDILVKQCA